MPLCSAAHTQTLHRRVLRCICVADTPLLLALLVARLLLPVAPSLAGLLLALRLLIVNQHVCALWRGP